MDNRLLLCGERKMKKFSKKKKQIKCTADGISYISIIAKKHRLKIISDLDKIEILENSLIKPSISSVFEEKRCHICNIVLNKNAKYCTICGKPNYHKFNPQACIDWDSCIVPLENRHCDKCEKRKLK